MKIFFHKFFNRPIQTVQFAAEKFVILAPVFFFLDAIALDHIVNAGVRRLRHFRPFLQYVEVIGKGSFPCQLFLFISMFGNPS